MKIKLIGLLLFAVCLLAMANERHTSNTRFSIIHSWGYQGQFCSETECGVGSLWFNFQQTPVDSQGFVSSLKEYQSVYFQGVREPDHMLQLLWQTKNSTAAAEKTDVIFPICFDVASEHFEVTDESHTDAMAHECSFQHSSEHGWVALCDVHLNAMAGSQLLATYNAGFNSQCTEEAFKNRPPVGPFDLVLLSYQKNGGAESVTINSSNKVNKTGSVVIPAAGAADGMGDYHTPTGGGQSSPPAPPPKPSGFPFLPDLEMTILVPWVMNEQEVIHPEDQQTLQWLSAPGQQEVVISYHLNGTQHSFHLSVSDWLFLISHGFRPTPLLLFSLIHDLEQQQWQQQNLRDSLEFWVEEQSKILEGNGNDRLPGTENMVRLILEQYFALAPLRISIHQVVSDQLPASERVTNDKEPVNHAPRECMNSPPKKIAGEGERSFHSHTGSGGSTSAEGYSQGKEQFAASQSASARFNEQGGESNLEDNELKRLLNENLEVEPATPFPDKALNLVWFKIAFMTCNLSPARVAGLDTLLGYAKFTEGASSSINVNEELHRNGLFKKGIVVAIYWSENLPSSDNSVNRVGGADKIYNALNSMGVEEVMSLIELPGDAQLSNNFIQSLRKAREDSQRNSDPERWRALEIYKMEAGCDKPFMVRRSSESSNNQYASTSTHSPVALTLKEKPVAPMSNIPSGTKKLLCPKCQHPMDRAMAAMLLDCGYRAIKGDKIVSCDGCLKELNPDAEVAYHCSKSGCHTDLCQACTTPGRFACEFDHKPLVCRDAVEILSEYQGQGYECTTIRCDKCKYEFGNSRFEDFPLMWQCTGETPHDYCSICIEKIREASEKVSTGRNPAASLVTEKVMKPALSSKEKNMQNEHYDPSSGMYLPPSMRTERRKENASPAVYSSQSRLDSFVPPVPSRTASEMDICVKCQKKVSCSNMQQSGAYSKTCNDCIERGRNDGYGETASACKLKGVSTPPQSGSSIKENTEAESGVGFCHMCYEKKINTMFLPCGHARTCSQCATIIKNSGQPCPYCRKEISGTQRIFL